MGGNTLQPVLEYTDICLSLGTVLEFDALVACAKLALFLYGLYMLYTTTVIKLVDFVTNQEYSCLKTCVLF